MERIEKILLKIERVKTNRNKYKNPDLIID